MVTVSENEELRETLGDAIRFEPVWWLNGDPYIKGGVRTSPFSQRYAVLTSSEDSYVARQCGPLLPHQGARRFVSACSLDCSHA